MAGVDVVTFFREATLRICGGLDLGAATGSFLRYVREHVPIDHVLITYNDGEEEGVERALVWASTRSTELLDLALPLSEATVRRWGEVLGWGQESSAVSLQLVDSGWRIGTAHFVATGPGRLVGLHSQLLEQLEGPVTIALSNYMRHVDALAQRQQLAEENRRLRAELSGRAPGGDPDRTEALRALEQTLSQALSICRADRGAPGVALAPVGAEGPISGAAGAGAGADELRLDRLMSRHIRQVLHQTGGRVEGVGGAAELLGLHPSTLRKRMRKLGVPFGRVARAVDPARPA